MSDPTDMAWLIRQSNLIEDIDDPTADLQSMKAWRYLTARVGLNDTIIRTLQSMIVETQDTLTYDQRGQYRTVLVDANGKPTPHPSIVPSLMQNWLLDYRELDPIAAHVRFERIHPFYDGNGRTGRMLLWFMQLQRGMPFTELLASERDSYYEWFT